MSADNAPGPSTRFRIFRAAARLAPLIGPRAAARLFAAAAAAGWRLAPAREAIAANLSFLGLVPEPRDNLRHFGRYLGEFFGVGGEPSRLSECLGECDFASLRTTRATGKGALVVTMHYGNWELGALALAREFGQVAVIIRRTGDEWLDERIRQCRGANLLLDVEGGLRPVWRALETGGIVCAAIDEPRSEGERVDLLTGWLIMPSALLNAAARTGAALIPVCCGRDAGGRISVRLAPPARSGQEVADRFGEWLREDPTQWVLMRKLEGA